MKEKIANILGLETAPDGTKYMLLLLDEDGNIDEGIPFEDEVDQLIELFNKK